MTKPTTTTAASKGTRLAAALDQRLAGDDPLLDVVAWYATQYNNTLSTDERLGLEGNPGSSDIETAARLVHHAQSDPGVCVGCRRPSLRQGVACGCLAMLEDTRAMVVFPYTLTHDLEGFETRLDLFRRYALAAIRDRSTHGDEVAVEKGRKTFLHVCEQGIEDAEKVGDPAYAAMMQRQREEFCRVLSGQAPLPSLEESNLPSPQPVDSDADVSTMPVHELFVGYFVSCAAEGMPFFEALDSILELARQPLRSSKAGIS
jgi:hypothetical protein